jgi:hypothetical protein
MSTTHAALPLRTFALASHFQSGQALGVTNDDDTGWVGFTADREGRPVAEGNEHLSAEQRADFEQRAEERATRRGRLQAVVVVSVFENGEGDAQVSFPEGSTIDLWDRPQVNAAVAIAAQTLRDWR